MQGNWKPEKAWRIKWSCVVCKEPLYHLLPPGTLVDSKTPLDIPAPFICELDERAWFVQREHGDVLLLDMTPRALHDTWLMLAAMSVEDAVIRNTVHYQCPVCFDYRIVYWETIYTPKRYSMAQDRFDALTGREARKKRNPHN